MREAKEAQSSVTVTTDISGDWGCGGYWDAEWFMLQWAGTLPHYSEGVGDSDNSGSDMGKALVG